MVLEAADVIPGPSTLAKGAKMAGGFMGLMGIRNLGDKGIINDTVKLIETLRKTDPADRATQSDIIKNTERFVEAPRSLDVDPRREYPKFVYELPEQTGISPAAMDLMITGGRKKKSIPMGEVLINEDDPKSIPRLLKAYPGLPSRLLEYWPSLKKGQAQFNPATGGIESGRFDPKSARKYLIHETGHYVEGKEGLSGGANPNTAAEVLRRMEIPGHYPEKTVNRLMYHTDPDSMYIANAGEQLAEASAKANELRSRGRTSRIPDLYTVDPASMWHERVMLPEWYGK
jgi:hypothetical protein